MELIEFIIQIFFLVVEIGVFCLFIWQIRKLGTQIKFNIIMDYYARYSNIFQHLPNAINYNKFDLNGDLKEKEDERDKIIKSGRSYFELCSEEFYFQKKKIIDNKTWKTMQEGIKYTFNLNGFKQIWQEIKDEGYYQDFLDYVDEIMHENLSKNS